MVLQSGTVASDNAADDHERNEGASRATEEERFAADLVDQKEGGQCGEGIDDSCEGISVCTMYK